MNRPIAAGRSSSGTDSVERTAKTPWPEEAAIEAVTKPIERGESVRLIAMEVRPAVPSAWSAQPMMTAGSPGTVSTRSAPSRTSAPQPLSAARAPARQPERAEEALRHCEGWARAAATAPWAQAVALRCRALIADRPEQYAQALRLHEKGGRPFERARTELLYGEWPRRARRPNEARDMLRSALATFERLRAEPWTRRAGAELRAAGERSLAGRVPADHLIDRLTPQELQMVRLAKGGSSSREIAAQLFLSRRTVEHHLYKAYPKLGVCSRRELALLDLS